MKQLQGFLDNQRKKDLEHEEYIRNLLKESDKIEGLKENILSNLRPARSKDYLKWLKGYVGNGNSPTHNYDYNLPNDNFYVAVLDFCLDTGFYGAQSFNIIVPKNVKIDIKEQGHCNFYYMENYTSKGSWIPVYKDTIF